LIIHRSQTIKPLLLKGKSFPSSNFSEPKKVVCWDRVKCLNESVSICSNNHFQILENNFLNSDSSTDDLSINFASTAFSIANDLEITSSDKVDKSFFHMNQKIFTLHQNKCKLYKEIKRLDPINNSDELKLAINNYNKFCEISHKKCNEYGMEEYLVFPLTINNSENTDAPSYDLNCLLLLFNCIWNGDFPNSWNEASIIFYS